ncbi:NACHT domain-containing protein [Actinoplanes aureus]|uniref:NACHT domain-containing protein n=1 Tax=Actinoplanes aureus TaxID=2792083 RepID=A0A931CH25_9ACTN|nr:NACHT domain-containing protein [Actinoplanes aureus]MBG0564790.1 NACHT domain-containing protein [Actinoplanes aureus]
MDAILSGVLTRLAGRAAEHSIGSLLQEANKERYEQQQVAGLYLPTGEVVDGALTDAQLRNIAAFLGKPPAIAVLQAYYLALVTGEIHEELADRARDEFETQVQKWCVRGEPDDWSSYADVVWSLSKRSLESVAPPPEFLPNLSLDDRGQLQFAAVHPLLEGGSMSMPAHLRDMLAVSCDNDRFTRVRQLVSDITRILREPGGTVSLSHTRVNFLESTSQRSIDWDSLYVDRHLVVESNAAEPVLASEALLPATNPVRAVVIGDPGVGKSTLVKRLTSQLAFQEGAQALVPLVLHCRHYAVQANTSILAAIKRDLEVNLSITVSDEALADMLSVGRGYVIFDGIDELLDVQQRQTFVSRAQAFSKRFPLTSIAVTSRRVGYSRSRFDAEFVTYELREFTEDQVDEYSTKWFAVTGRPALDRVHFIHELASLSDIQSNPLMLSLLCTLYGTRGSIPRNRREVYRECADLLFRRWDSMRHIEQTVDHVEYGLRLMRDLAFLFYRSGQADVGIGEVAVRTLISRFFQDTAAIDDVTAVIRAQEFLDFCAERAWLLTSIGRDQDGQRLFSFTHRTFLEYFTAEAMTRNAGSIEELVDETANAFHRDPSSVIPEIVIQAAEDKVTGGASLVLSGLLARDRSRSSFRHTALCLRGLNAAPVPRRITEDALARLSEQWHETQIDLDESSIALLSLYRDPRSVFLGSVHERLRALDNARSATQAISEGRCLPYDLLRCWSRFALAGRTALYEEDWQRAVESCLDWAATHLADDLGLDDGVRSLLVLSGRRRLAASMGLVSSPNFFVHRVGGEFVPGVGMRLVNQLGGGSDLIATDQADLAVVERWLPGPTLSPAVSEGILRVAHAYLDFGGDRSGIPLVHPVNRALLLWLAFIEFEATRRLALTGSIVSREAELHVIYRAIATRAHAIGLRSAPAVVDMVAAFSPSELRNHVDVPDWAKGWCAGVFNLTRHPNAREEEGRAPLGDWSAEFDFLDPA